VVPGETDYTNNTKDIVFTATGYPDLTLEQAWTYDEFLTLTTPDTPISLTPSPASSVASTATKTYQVDTNRHNGYAMTIETRNTSSDYTDHPNDLVCTTLNPKRYFTALTEILPTLPNNTWAYKLNGQANWLPPTSTPGDTLKQTATPTPIAGESVDIVFGAKVDYHQAPCEYGGTVVVTVVGNY
jgi:hypothetical protein